MSTGLAVKRISARKLAKIQKKWDPTMFIPTLHYSKRLNTEVWRAPRIGKRIQADMRKNCIATGIDPLSIGLPPEHEKKPPRTKPPKGSKADREKPLRQAKIKKALNEMPQIVEKWRAEKLAEKEKGRPSLPY